MLFRSRDTWQSQAVKLIMETEPVFFSYRDVLTGAQWTLLKAVASENKVFSPTSKDFLVKFHLGTSATVVQSMKALIKKELIFKDYNKKGQSFYSVYDLLFQHWIRNQ